MVDRVLVTGGTGKTGRLVAEQLATRGVEARIATRNPVTPTQVRVEWGDVGSHRAALDGADAIYLVAPTDRMDHPRRHAPFAGTSIGARRGPVGAVERIFPRRRRSYDGRGSCVAPR